MDPEEFRLWYRDSSGFFSAIRQGVCLYGNVQGVLLTPANVKRPDAVKYCVRSEFYNKIICFDVLCISLHNICICKLRSPHLQVRKSDPVPARWK